MIYGRYIQKIWILLLHLSVCFQSAKRVVRWWRSATGWSGVPVTSSWYVGNMWMIYRFMEVCIYSYMYVYTKIYVREQWWRWCVTGWSGLRGIMTVAPWLPERLPVQYASCKHKSNMPLTIFPLKYASHNIPLAICPSHNMPLTQEYLQFLLAGTSALY